MRPQQQNPVPASSPAGFTQAVIAPGIRHNPCMLPIPVRPQPWIAPAAMKSLSCPCGSGRRFEHCCGPLLRGERMAPDAETLMRSRYTAHARGDTAWLLATWHPDTRPGTLDLQDGPRTRWTGLQVLDFRVLDADHAEVDFIAHCRIGGRAHRLQERSRFLRVAGRWLYLDGDTGED